MDSLMIAAAAAVATAGATGIDVPTNTNKQQFLSKYSRVVGSDSGKKVEKQSRNELCGCGSGSKFKKCCGRKRSI